MSAAWKALELRICRALGGRRAGPIGAAVSDCVNVPFSVEIKRSTRPGPPILSKWILQARQQSKREQKPWLVVVAGHNDRRPIVAMDFWAFAQLAQEAGRIPTPIDEPEERLITAAEKRRLDCVNEEDTVTETPTQPQPTTPQPNPPKPDDTGTDDDTND